MPVLDCQDYFPSREGTSVPHSFISLFPESKDKSLISELESNLWERIS